jgi:bla regulator protein BlaR1
MNFINNIISGNLINAIGWTIIHSLWQGAAAALGFASVMFFLRRSNARTRYLAGVMTLMLVLVMSMVTFVSIYQPGIQGIPVTGEDGSPLLLTGAITNRGDIAPPAFFKNYFNRHLPLVVTVWLLGVLVLVLRLAGGYLYNQRLKLHRNRPLPEAWQNRLETFCRQAGIGKTISLVESALVKIPMTVGHFKPVILFPLGLVTGLPRDQVEALLAHELAHILRKDYLVNILQSFVDILFFYHPGVRWISSQVRAERENCCDDIAVSLSGNSLNVARALANIQDYGVRTPYPAMAAGGKRWGSSRGLLTRVKRLVSPPKQYPGFAAGTIGTVVLVLGLLTLIVSTHEAAALSRQVTNDQSPAVESVQTGDEEKDKEKEPEKQQNEPKADEKEKLKEQELKLKELETLKSKQEARLRDMERGMREEEAEMRKQEELMRVQETEMRKQEEKMREFEAQMRKQEAELRDHEAKVRALEKELDLQYVLLEELLIKEMYRDKLISDPGDFEFQFKEGQLFINGKKQSDELYKKYKNLYENATGKKLDETSGIKIVKRK